MDAGGLPRPLTAGRPMFAPPPLQAMPKPSPCPGTCTTRQPTRSSSVVACSVGQERCTCQRSDSSQLGHARFDFLGFLEIVEARRTQEPHVQRGPLHKLARSRCSAIDRNALVWGVTLHCVRGMNISAGGTNLSRTQVSSQVHVEVSQASSASGKHRAQVRCPQMWACMLRYNQKAGRPCSCRCTTLAGVW